jgi:hypothetical protein
VNRLHTCDSFRGCPFAYNTTIIFSKSLMPTTTSISLFKTLHLSRGEIPLDKAALQIS